MIRRSSVTRRIRMWMSSRKSSLPMVAVSREYA
jgi:hypothetical protein